MSEEMNYAAMMESETHLVPILHTRREDDEGNKNAP